LGYNGSGTFNLEYDWTQDAANGLDISSSRMMGQEQDIANGLSNCVTRDGQSPPSADLPMGGNVLTDLGNGVQPGDSASLGQIKTLINTAFPVGAIVMWNTTTAPIPSNFQLCDGTNGTPNLTDKFVVGAGATYANGASGGAASVRLSVAQLPAHAHGVNDPTHAHVVSDPTHTHAQDPHFHSMPDSSLMLTSGAGFGGYTGGPDQLGSQNNTNGATPAIHAAATGITINAASTGISLQTTGSGEAVNTLPPYYALCFVQRMN